MHTKRCTGWLVWLTGAFFFSCQSGDLDLGQGLIKPLELQVQSVDSVSIRLSTVVVPDSFVTSSDTNLLVGRWNDAQTGQLLARSFASVDYTTNDLKDQKGLRLDSLVLELGYSFAYGDTTTNFALAVHTLQQPMTQQTYYNNSTVAYNSKAFVERTGLVHPNSGTRRLRFRLDATLAQTFFDQLISGTINDATTLAERWPGFALTSTSTANAFVAFAGKSGSGLRLYYHATDLSRTTSSLWFPLGLARFSQLLTDRRGSSLQNLTTRTDIVGSAQSDRASYVCVGAGLRTRLEFPYLGQFDKPEQFAGLNSAILTIEPIRRTDRDNTAPPSQLALYQTNSQNELLTTVLAGSTGSTEAVATYAYDPTALELVDAYSFDLTQYVGYVIRKQITNRPLLLTVPLSTTDLRTMIQRVSLGDQSRSSDRVRLRLLMTSVQ